MQIKELKYYAKIHLQLKKVSEIMNLIVAKNEETALAF